MKSLNIFFPRRILNNPGHHGSVIKRLHGHVLERLSRGSPVKLPGGIPENLLGGIIAALPGGIAGGLLAATSWGTSCCNSCTMEESLRVMLKQSQKESMKEFRRSFFEKFLRKFLPGGLPEEPLKRIPEGLHDRFPDELLGGILKKNLGESSWVSMAESLACFFEASLRKFLPGRILSNPGHPGAITTRLHGEFLEDSQ